MKPHQDALNKAKIQLMYRGDTVFFTTVLFNLIHVWDETIPTACTNGKFLKIKPDYFMELTPNLRLSLLMHETYHVVLMHMLRLSGRNLIKWNVAADYVINAYLKKNGFEISPNWLYDPQYEDMATEQVYDLLPDDVAEPQMMDIIGPEFEDIVKPEIEDIIVQASVQAEQQGHEIGSLPGEVQRFLNKLLKPKLPWERILFRYMKSVSQSDYSMAKGNKRFLPEHHLPSLQSTGMGKIAIAIDASLSVSEHEFSTFTAEIASIFKKLKPEEITLVTFDGDIRSEVNLKNLRDLSKATFIGKGGTDIYPVLEWAKENKPELLLIFTDGEFDIPPKAYAPKCPIIWLIHDDPTFSISFGKTIHYSIKEKL